jgi:hypothetical protein
MLGTLKRLRSARRTVVLYVPLMVEQNIVVDESQRTQTISPLDLGVQRVLLRAQEASALNQRFFVAERPAVASDAQLADESSFELSDPRGFADRVKAKWASEEMNERLRSLADLSNGWNSYEAPSPSQDAIRNARGFLALLSIRGLKPDRLEPSAMGGIGISFTSAKREVATELYNNGTAHALFADDSTGEMTTRVVTADERGFRELINSLREFLYVKAAAGATSESSISG